jgi:hypothetical protein
MSKYRFSKHGDSYMVSVGDEHIGNVKRVWMFYRGKQIPAGWTPSHENVQLASQGTRKLAADQLWEEYRKRMNERGS